jgi:hypothetical protein
MSKAFVETFFPVVNSHVTAQSPRVAEWLFPADVVEACPEVAIMLVPPW